MMIAAIKHAVSRNLTLEHWRNDTDGAHASWCWWMERRELSCSKTAGVFQPQAGLYRGQQCGNSATSGQGLAARKMTFNDSLGPKRG